MKFYLTLAIAIIFIVTFFTLGFRSRSWFSNLFPELVDSSENWFPSGASNPTIDYEAPTSGGGFW